VYDPLDVTYQTIWAGIGRYSAYSRFGGMRTGLLKSTDGGSTWTEVDGSGALRGLNISGLAVRGNTIVVTVNVADSYTCPNIGIFRSTDGGTIFTKPGTIPAGNAYFLANDPTNANVLYADIGSWASTCTFGGVNGIYKSSDTGATWTKVSDPVMDALILDGITNNIEISVGNSGAVFVGIMQNGQLWGLFTSTTSGASWVQMDTPKTNENGTIIGIHPKEKPGGQGSIHFSILASMFSSNLVYLGGDRQPSQYSGGVETGFWPNSIGAFDYSGRLFRGDASFPLGSQFVH